MYTILGSDQQTYGPVDQATVISWIQTGQANAQTQINRQGDPHWVELGTLPEFAASLGATTATQAQATMTGKSNAPTVFGILNFVMSLLCGGLSGAGYITLLVLAITEKVELVAAGYGIIAMGLIAVLCWLAIFVSGVGLLMRREWGRKLAMAGGMGVVISMVILLVLGVVGNAQQMDLGGAGNSAYQTGRAVGTAGGLLVRTAVFCIYPALLHSFMRKPEVQAAFK